MNINEVARLTNVSVRTLHHYDAIGLLSPKRNAENGYREYSDGDLDRLQQILAFRKCGFPLKSIRLVLSASDYDRSEAVAVQLKYLYHERDKIGRMIETLEKTKQYLKGEIDMSHEEKFAGFDFTQNPYEEEARKLWGDAAVDESNEKLQQLDQKGREALSEDMNDIFRVFAKQMDSSPESEAVQQLTDRYYRFLNSNFGHHYSYEAFAGLGEMYVQDTRFQQNIDRFGEGLSEFMAKAMKCYADQNSLE